MDLLKPFLIPVILMTTFGFICYITHLIWSALRSPSESSINHFAKLAFILSIAVTLGVTVFIVNFNVAHLRFLSGDVAQWGQVGDFFGGMLNPILGFASFIALLYTIRIQSEELHLTKLELTRSADAHEKSEKILKMQLDESKNQNEMSHYHELFRSIELRLHSELNERITIIESTLENYSQLVNHCFYEGQSNSDFVKARYLYDSKNTNELEAVFFNIGLSLGRLSVLLCEYKEKFKETASYNNYVTQYRDLVAKLHLLGLLNAKGTIYQIFRIASVFDAYNIQQSQIDINQK